MSISDRKEREKIQRRKDIIDAAEDIFLKNGINKITMDSVAEKAELSKGTLYLYFKDKHDLIMAVDSRGHKKLYSMYCEANKFYENGLDKLKKTMLTYMNFLNDNTDYAQLFLKFGKFEYEKATETGLELAENVDKCFEYVFQAMELGIKDGSIKKDIDVKNAITFLWSSMLGWIQLKANRNNELIQKWLVVENDTMTEYVCHMVDIYLDNRE